MNYDDVESLIEYGERRDPSLILLDADLLLYACNADCPQHAIAAKWLRNLWSGKEMIGLP